MPDTLQLAGVVPAQQTMTPNVPQNSTRVALASAEERHPRFFEAPEFWISGYHEVCAFLDTLTRGCVWEIGRSYGGHAIRAVAYGDKEPIERTATYSSAIAAGHPASFFDRSRRAKPVLVILSSIHGAEIEGCVACINQMHVLETGADLRGRRWDDLREMVAATRLVLVPLAQPDGRIRSACFETRPGTSTPGGMPGRRPPRAEAA
ncbi:MAG: hypothetical protein HY332_24750 [Chloroflexi bacterium]|nr:hypothetical protein [Chloroflexota bacterium]